MGSNSVFDRAPYICLPNQRPCPAVSLRLDIIKDPVPLIEKSKLVSTETHIRASRFSLVHHLSIRNSHHGLNKLGPRTLCSRPEDNLTCRQGVQPPINQSIIFLKQQQTFEPCMQPIYATHLMIFFISGAKAQRCSP